MIAVGKESDFVEALKNVIEVDYDAVEAYDAAISRLNNEHFKSALKNFKDDHLRHIKELSNLLRKRNEKTPEGPDIKQWLTKGKVIIANLMGDGAIIDAMISNEKDTNCAYQNINEREDIWDDAKEILKRGLEDEKRHKDWLEKNKEKI